MAPTLSKKLRIHAECRWRRSGDCHLNFFELLQVSGYFRLSLLYDVMITFVEYVVRCDHVNDFVASVRGEGA